MVTGGSYGGYMTLAAMTHYNDRLRCAIDIVGISNFVTFLESTEAYRRDLRRVEYGDERIRRCGSSCRRSRPHQRVEDHEADVRRTGEERPRFLTEAEQVVKAIRANGGAVWFLMAKDEGHASRRSETSTSSTSPR